MTEVTEIKCDSCGEDLTYTGNCEDWRVVLGSQPKRLKSPGGAVTLMAIPKPIPQAKHFCGVGCLAKWLADEHPNALQLYEKQQSHREFLKRGRPA